MLRRGIQGVVMLRVLINPDGTPGDIKVDKSSGYASLDRSAMQAAKRWKFNASKRDGAAVQEWVRVPVSFKLEG
ncbi:MAG: energy transducer TonB [Blastochloris sp.]|nr:energy transducer TonB [Blastochloris sp.]